MKNWLLLLGCLLAFASMAQSSRREVWAWKDANGVTHYSDYPAPGARKVVLNGSPTSSSAPSPAAGTAERPVAAKVADEASYDSLEIWSPENEAAYFETDSSVDIRLRSQPGLAPNHQLLTYVDDKLLPGTDVYDHTVANLERGTHTITSMIVDGNGREKIRSAPVIFYMKQTTMNNSRNVGPSQRPQPTPKPTPKPLTPKGG